MAKRNKKDIYYSKVMLFGEYSIIVGSMGLTIPYTHFRGELRFMNSDSYTNLDFARQSALRLRSLLDFLHDLEVSGKLTGILDLKKFGNDLNKGLYFESTIPEGYGLGSSGALVAAVYRAYALKPITADPGMRDDELVTLKKIFSQIESYYHGTSSGIDPLICYINHPIVLENAHHIASVGIPRDDVLKDDAIFLVNTGSPGKTAPLVNLFMKKLDNPDYNKAINETMIPLTNSCVTHLLAGRLNHMYNSLKSLSAFQLSHFSEMIPDNITDIWAEGLSNELFTLKLCGSGGGGFILGFTRHYSETKAFMEQNGKSIIPVYQEV